MKHDMKGWVVTHVYGSFKTALAVARKIRSKGHRARAEDRNGNAVVLQPKERFK